MQKAAGKGRRSLQMCTLVSFVVQRCIIAEFLRTMAWDEKSCCLTILPQLTAFMGCHENVLWTTELEATRVDLCTCCTPQNHDFFLPEKSNEAVGGKEQTWEFLECANYSSFNSQCSDRIFELIQVRRTTTWLLLLKQNAFFLLINSPSNLNMALDWRALDHFTWCLCGQRWGIFCL